MSPYFLSDACLRCGREFKNGESCLVVFGGPDAKYREVGLVICCDCFQGEKLDKVMLSDVYLRKQAGTTWPRYYGSYSVEGWAKVSRLSNGTYRIGLHRGHVEVWTKEMVQTLGNRLEPGVMGYSKDYGLYGPKSLGDFIVHTEEEIRFVDLTEPEPPGAMGAETALDRFRRLDERKVKELLAHYGDVFGKPPRLEDIKNGEVPEEFLRNVKTLSDMFSSGKVGVSENCPTCQELMRHGGKGRGIARSHGFISLLPPCPSGPGSGEPESKSVGRYSEALDKQVELANLWSSPEMRRRFEAVAAERFAERGSYYEASQAAGMILPPLLRGATFYWSEPICRLIESAARSIPETWALREEALEALHAFAWLARPVTIPSSEAPVCAIGWFPVRRQGGRVEEVSPPHERPVLTDPSRDALCLVFFSLSPSFPVPFPRTLALWPIMAQIRGVQAELECESVEGDLHSGFTIREKAALFATMVAFLEQRILISPRFRADRAARRRSEKARQAPPSEEVCVVALRHVAYREEGGHRDVEWTCQWIVRGHWRSQWYPGQKHHRPKWIAPYVKGPEDKPLREPGRLFAVVR